MSSAALAVAVGPIAQFAAAATVVTGISIATAQALGDENEKIDDDAKKAQFYFLYGTRERLGLSR